MNLRHGARTNIRFNLEVIQATSHCLDCDLETSLIFAAVLAGNAAAIEEDPILARLYAGGPTPDHLRRPMRVQRIAESLNLPRETTRTKVAAMTANGLLEKTGAGLIVSAATLGSARLMPMTIAHLGALARCIQRLSVAGCADLAPGERLADPPFPPMWGAMRAITQHVLRGVVDLQVFTSPGNLLQAYLMLAIMDRSAGWLSDGDLLLHAEYDDPAPLSAHRRVTAQGLAKVLSLPRETVRRNMHALVLAGRLRQEPAGFTISDAVRGIGTSRAREMQERTNADLTRLVRKIRNIGALTAV
jgi:DNA-binding Lrp family transcriptional regulator